MTSDEVTAFSMKVDPQAIVAYWGAVGQRTDAIVKERGSQRWEEPVDLSQVRAAIVKLAPNANIDRIMAFYQGMTRGWAIAHYALVHTFGHFNEAGGTRSALGFPGI